MSVADHAAIFLLIAVVAALFTAVAWRTDRAEALVGAGISVASLVLAVAVWR